MKVTSLQYCLILTVACVLGGLCTVGYAEQLGPLFVPELVASTVTLHLTQTSTIQSFTTSVTTTGTTTYVSTYVSTKVLTIGRSGPTCPYGGQYCSRICTSLCGCQYNVCVSFDYNCANDYPAVYADRTTIQTSKLRTTGTDYLVRTDTLTYFLTATSESYTTTTTVETRVMEVPNPTQRTLRVTGFSLIAVGALSFLTLVWKSPKEIRIAPPRRR
jgi:hypothetical protein